MWAGPEFDYGPERGPDLFCGTGAGPGLYHGPVVELFLLLSLMDGEGFLKTSENKLRSLNFLIFEGLIIWQ
jgi:hypothetical protein